MEYLILSWVNWLAKLGLFSLILIPVAYWYIQHKYNYWAKKGIKSPPVIPFVGNVMSISRPIPMLQIDFREKYGRFFGMYRGRKPVLCIQDPVIIKRILVKDFPLFRNRVGSGSTHKIMSQNLVATRDDKWKRIRSILSPMFTTSKLKKMESLMTQCSDSMIKKFERLADTNQSFLAHNVMGNFTMDVIAKCAFATETDAHAEVENPFVTNARSMFNFSMFRALAMFAVPQVVQSFLNRMRVPFFFNKETDFFIDLAFHLIKQRKVNKTKPYDDMLELMVKAEHGLEKNFEKEDLLDSHHVNVGEEEIEQEQQYLSNIIGSKYLSEEEIVAQSIVFFLAGYETTASTLTFCFYELATNPSIQDKLYQEIKSVVDQGKPLDYNNVMKLPYLDAVISETLRLHPPALALSREAAEEYHIPEYNHTMEKGEGVTIPIYSIHHDPEFYKDPERFDPERFMPENRDKIIPYTYLPFGGGPRNCIGMRFALSEAKIGLSNVINKFVLHKTEQTCNDLKVANSLFILKTTPIYVGVKRRE